MSDKEVANREVFTENLGRDERLVMILHYAEELTPTEIGLVLEISEGRVRSILDSLRDRAKALLRRGPRVAVA